MSPRLPDVISRLQKYTVDQTNPIPHEIYRPSIPQLIRIAKPYVTVSGVIGGAKYSTDAIGIATPNDTDMRISIINGIPETNIFDQKAEFATTSEMARKIAQSPIGSWPNSDEKMRLHQSITTDIHHLPGDEANYLVGSIGSLDSFAFAFVPNEQGIFDGSSFRIIYANPLIDNAISTLDLHTMQINPQATQNPFLLPKGSVVLSSTFDGLMALAKLFNSQYQSIIRDPNAYESKKAMEAALQRFFMPLIRNLDRYGLTYLDSITAAIQSFKLDNQSSADIALVFAHLDTPIGEFDRFTPQGQQLLLCRELNEYSYDELKEMTYVDRNPLLIKYGREVANDLIDDLIRSGQTSNILFPKTMALLLVHRYLSPFAQTWFKDKGISLEHADKMTRLKKNTQKNTSAYSSLHTFIAGQNQFAVPQAMGEYDWSILGKGQQFQRHMMQEMTYSSDFRKLMEMTDVPEYIQQRKQIEGSSHVLDLFGPGIIEGIEHADSVTAVTLNSRPNILIKNLQTIDGNIYSRHTWKKIAEKSRNIGGYDITFCRPVGPFDFFIKNELNPSNVVNGYLSAFHTLLSRTYELMSDRNSTILFTLPRFTITPDVYGSEKKMVTEQFRKYKELLLSLGYDIVVDHSDFDPQFKRWIHDIWRITRHKESPQNMRIDFSKHPEFIPLELTAVIG